MSDTRALRMDLKPSHLLACALVLAHGLALGAAWISLGGWARYLAGAGILVSLGSCLRQALLRTPRQALSLELHEDGRASWKNRQGVWREGVLGSRHFVSAALVVLELEQAPGRHKWVVLMADSASPDDLRRLRAWLRWRREPARAEPE